MALFVAKYDNIFNSAEHYVITIPVNCEGIAGAGLAKQAKQVSKVWYNEYYKACKNKLLSKAGDVVIHDGIYDSKHLVWASFATKTKWRDLSNLADIERGLVNLHIKLQEYRYNYCAIPPLGCGLGGLNERDLVDLLFKYFGRSEVDILYFPQRKES